MVQIIVTTVLVVALAVLVAFNLRATTSIRLFGAQFNDVSVAVIALLSFALGVVYSLVLYVSRYFRRRRMEQLEQRHREVARREQDLASRESASPARSSVSSSAADGSTGARTPRLGLFRRARRQR